MRDADRKTRLDRFIPSWDLHEVHRLRIVGDPRDVMAATAEVTWSEAPWARNLSALIGNVKPKDQPIIDAFGGLDGALDRTDDELVFGAVDPIADSDARTLKGLTAEEFSTFDTPGYVKMAFNFRYAAEVLTTETRVALTDSRSRRKFQLYWFLIRLGSGLTRISILHAIRRRVLSEHPPAAR